MNYAAMARAIRAERRAIWEGLGRPYPPVVMVKGRQCGYYPPVSMTMPIPWGDFNIERQVAEFRKHYPLRPEDCFAPRTTGKTNGLLAQMKTP